MANTEKQTDNYKDNRRREREIRCSIHPAEFVPGKTRTAGSPDPFFFWCVHVPTNLYSIYHANGFGLLYICVYTPTRCCISLPPNHLN